MSLPLLTQIIDKYKYPVLTEDTVDEFINSQDECILFFTENPIRFPESNDVAMILPELVKEYANRFTVAVIDQGSQRQLQSRYGFNEWPSVVFLRKGEYLGVISRVQNWGNYITQINTILSSEPKSTPGIGIPVVKGSVTSCSQYKEQ